MKIVFMGTPDFSVPVLETIIKEGYEVVGVVTQPDRPVGRKRILTPTPVKQKALEHNIPVFQPEKIKEDYQTVLDWNPDLIITAAFGQIIPKILLDAPKFGCINVHASLLPKYRGGAPIHKAIIDGEKETGVTIMYMDVKMDTGDMILKEKVTIGEDETTGELWDRLSKIGGELLVKTLEQIEARTAPREKQGEDYTMAPMLNKDMAKIDWENKSAIEVKNLVRGLNPIMGAYTFWNGKKIKFWKVDIAKENEIMVDNLETLKNGTVVVSNPKDGLYIKTKKGIIKVLEIQGENAKRMPIGDFLRGNNISEFEIFE